MPFWIQPLLLGLAFSNPKPLRQVGKCREGKLNTWWKKVRLGSIANKLSIFAI